MRLRHRLIPLPHAHPCNRPILKKIKHGRLEWVATDGLRPFHERLSDIEALLPVTV